jgi:hypothetical protein
MIKTEFWNDEKLATVSRDARLTFIALWNLSDDYGSVRGHPLWLKNTIFPYDEINSAEFKKWLEELENIHVISPYDGEGEKYYYIHGFTKHQVISHPSQFKNPTPPSSLTEHSGRTPGGLQSERERERESKRTKSPPGVDIDFLTFWSAYPNRVGKGAAEKSWNKNNHPSLEIILEAIKKQKNWRANSGGKFRPEWKHPATWINQKCWEDEIAEVEHDPFG